MTRLTEEQFRVLPYEYEIISDSTNRSIGVTRDSAAPWTIETKPNKLRNVPIELDGIKFASGAEAKRYSELRTLEQAGLITDLCLQPVYKLFDAFADKFGRKHRAAVYIGDFAYIQDGQEICEDTKGYATAVFRLKWKMAIRTYPNVRFLAGG